MKRLALLTLAAIAAFSFVSTDAEAKPRRAVAAQCDPFDIFNQCHQQPAAASRYSAARVIRETYRARQASVIGGRPPGCPSRFCGCGASLEVFGRIIPRLNLARAWFAFPRTSPAPQMVAVRRGHVFVLKEHRGGKTWLVKDYNSGGGKTRLHERSIAGYAIVNPHAHAALSGGGLGDT